MAFFDKMFRARGSFPRPSGSQAGRANQPMQVRSTASTMNKSLPPEQKAITPNSQTAALNRSNTKFFTTR